MKLSFFKTDGSSCQDIWNSIYTWGENILLLFSSVQWKESHITDTECPPLTKVTVFLYLGFVISVSNLMQILSQDQGYDWSTAIPTKTSLVFQIVLYVAGCVCAKEGCGGGRSPLGKEIEPRESDWRCVRRRCRSSCSFQVSLEECLLLDTSVKEENENLISM